MGHKGIKDDFIACCEFRTPRRMPALALGLEFDYCRVGTYRDMRTNVEMMVESQVRAVRDFGYDWAIIFPDDYVEFEPLGLDMRDDEDHPTMPATYLPMTRETLSRFRIPDAKKEMRCPVHLEMIRRTQEVLGDKVLIMSRIGAPFSSLALIYGMDELFVKMLTDPDLVRDNIRFFIDHQIAFGKAQLEAGADLLWLGDCCAASKFIRVEHYREFAFDAAAQVASEVAKAGGLLIYHTNETSLPHLQEQARLPVHAVNVGEGVNIAKVKKSLETRRALMGNFNWAVLRDGPPERVADEAERMIRQNLPGSGYVFNTGEGILQNTPPENVAAMMTTVRRVGELAAELV